MSRSTPSARRRANLRALLKPRSVAFVGGRQIESCIATARDLGYDGELWTVNPNHASLAGIRCARSLDALPRVSDATFLAISREHTLDAVRKLAAMEAPGVVCHAAGYRELGPAHEADQARLVEAAGQDLALLGPNVMGFTNAFDRVALWGTHHRVAPVDVPGVALISQSGALVFGILAAERAYPLGYAISCGNQAVLSAAELMEATLDDERVRTIGLYAEGVVDGPAFAEALRRAAEQSVPVVLLRGGGTEASSANSISHTGTITVPNDFWRALVERYGLLQVDSPKQLVETTKLLAVAGPLPGSRVFFFSYSGGANTLVAEQARQRGLEVPEPSPRGTERLRPKLAESTVIANPCDVNLPWSAEDVISVDDPQGVAQFVLGTSEDRADAFTFLLDIQRQGEGAAEAWWSTLDAMIEVRRLAGLPTVVGSLLPEGIEPEQRERLLACGVAPLCGLRETLDALAAAAAYPNRRAAAAAAEPLMTAGRVPGPGLRVLDEWESKQALAPYGVELPEAWAGPTERASEAPVGFPVAVKALSHSLPHKAAAGGVELGARDADSIGQAVARIRERVSASTGIEVERVLVERMVEDGVAEILVGVERHPELGFALVVGRGGSEAETVADYRMVLLPAPDLALETTVDGLRLGIEPSARRALLETLRAVVDYVANEGGRLTEMDLNPVIITKSGRAVVADALIVMEAPNGA